MNSKLDVDEVDAYTDLTYLSDRWADEKKAIGPVLSACFTFAFWLAFDAIKRNNITSKDIKLIMVEAQDRAEYVIENSMEKQDECK